MGQGGCVSIQFCYVGSPRRRSPLDHAIKVIVGALCITRQVCLFSRLSLFLTRIYGSFSLIQSSTITPRWLWSLVLFSRQIRDRTSDHVGITCTNRSNHEVTHNKPICRIVMWLPKCWTRMFEHTPWFYSKTAVANQDHRAKLIPMTSIIHNIERKPVPYRWLYHTGEQLSHSRI